jgi:hypothetical protein
MMSEEWTIKVLLGMKRNIESLITDAIDRAVPDGIVPDREGYEMSDGGQWFKTTDVWECPESPFRLCMYHIINDRAMDCCVFCGEPYERK